ncbi:pentapeptide repeat-containing protein [Okeania sp.]|uniref:pentapeptide repeat-containing protein n=1 Tax=Okeania sp. TaxID=3100323 RepID=UPI002B4B8F5D|nr:pentapeptide repeat-containing protein [Okeania sp.]MEB3340933.1 pentapeptide repeat-containing protein [Okeania sp.]
MSGVLLLGIHKPKVYVLSVTSSTPRQVMDEDKFLEQYENVERDFSRRQIEDNFLEQYENGERDFSGIDLRKCYFFDALLMDINLSSANLENALIEGDIGNANFSGANLKKS